MPSSDSAVVWSPGFSRQKQGMSRPAEAGTPCMPPIPQRVDAKQFHVPLALERKCAERFAVAGRGQLAPGVAIHAQSPRRRVLLNPRGEIHRVSPDVELILGQAD